MTDTPEPIDWIEQGRKHFLSSKLHPERLVANYPTQDSHTPNDEANFILGFTAAQAEWDRGEGLNGLQSYMIELEETRDGKIVLKPRMVA